MRQRLRGRPGPSPAPDRSRLTKRPIVLVHAEQDYTTNLPLADLDRPENLLALKHNGDALTPEHGGPVRLLVPHLYL